MVDPMTPTPESFTRTILLRGMRRRARDVEGGCEMRLSAEMNMRAASRRRVKALDLAYDVVRKFLEGHISQTVMIVGPTVPAADVAADEFRRALADVCSTVPGGANLPNCTRIATAVTESPETLKQMRRTGAVQVWIDEICEEATP